MAQDQLTLLDCWPSPFAMRVKIALAEKGIEYEAKDQNLVDKSPLLLEMNPVHKMIPVLVHNGKPICESLIILQYIDEAWPDKAPLLPSDPHQRSQARFWADYMDKKIYSNAKKVLWEKEGKQEAIKRDLIEGLKTLEGELGEKLYFDGETIGFVDVALVPIACWFYTIETLENFRIEADCPKIIAWAKRCLEKESVSKALADPKKVYGFALQQRQRLGLD
uniref:Glutathione S-transferase n=1 Tax=Rhizophora mucronata TaxID=61149 RepID=A0A2P2P0Y2_RHIMU